MNGPLMFCYGGFGGGADLHVLDTGITQVQAITSSTERLGRPPTPTLLGLLLTAPPWWRGRMWNGHVNMGEFAGAKAH